jgi:hypothetical protein
VAPKGGVRSPSVTQLIAGETLDNYFRVQPSAIAQVWHCSLSISPSMLTHCLHYKDQV